HLAVELRVGERSRALGGALLVVEVERERRRVARMRRPEEGELEELERTTALARREGGGRIHGQPEGVVYRVPALRGVAHHALDATARERLRDLLGEPDEERGVAVEQRLVDHAIRITAVEEAARRVHALEQPRGRVEAGLAVAPRAVGEHAHPRSRG